MNILNRRIGRLGFALGYAPVLVVLLFIGRDPGFRPGHLDGDPKKYALMLAILLWSICLSAWRCHDYGKSAWSNFWTEQIPIVGQFLWVWDLLTIPGDSRHNSYGPVPKL